MSFFRKLYDDSYHHLSKKKIEEYKASIESSYNRLLSRYGSSYFNLAKFQERYRIAVKNGYDMYEFFKLEMEGIDEFLKKVAKSNLKQDTPSSTESSSDQAESPPTSQGSVFERIYEQYEKRIKGYPQVAIHPDASEEIERLLGCLLEFRKKIQPILIFIEEKFEKNRSTEKYLQDVKLLFDDLTKPAKSNPGRDVRGNHQSLPFIFSNYRFKVEVSGHDDHLIELADINVLKNVVELLRKLKKIVSWFDTAVPDRYLKTKVRYGDEEYEIEKIGESLVTDSNRILHDFRLEDF